MRKTIKYEEYLKNTVRVLKESQQEKERYTVEILDRNFVVYLGVYSPKYFFDTEFFAKKVPIKKDEEFLEIGSGTGVISVFAALKGASNVVAIDINPSAVENTKENARLNGVDNKITVLEGDVYEPLPDRAKFDTIFWNTPFGYIERESITILEKGVFDSKYKSIKKFIDGARKHLKQNGRLLIGFSTTIGCFDKLEELLQAAGFGIRLVAETEFVGEYPIKIELFELVTSNGEKPILRQLWNLFGRLRRCFLKYRLESVMKSLKHLRNYLFNADILLEYIAA